MNASASPLTAGAHMDRIYRRQRHIYDLTRKYYLLGRDALLRDLAPPPGGSVVEIGCGTGRNLIQAARLWPEARLFGLDVSPAMLETARANIGRAGLSDRIMVAEGDATGFEALGLFGHARFDRVFLSYTLSMIPDWQRALDQAASLLGPGDELRIVDFGQQERLPRAFRAMLFKWLRKFDVTPRSELFSAAEETAASRMLACQSRSRFRGYAWSLCMVSQTPSAAR